MLLGAARIHDMLNDVDKGVKLYTKVCCGCVGTNSTRSHQYCEWVALALCECTFEVTPLLFGPLEEGKNRVQFKDRMINLQWRCAQTCIRARVLGAAIGRVVR